MHLSYSFDSLAQVSPWVLFLILIGGFLGLFVPAAAGEQLSDEFFVDHLYQFQAKSDPDASRAAIADAYYRRVDKKENILTAVEEQCRWLRDLRFQDVDCFFKVFDLALFGGRKTSDRPAPAAHCSAPNS